MSSTDLDEFQHDLPEIQRLRPIVVSTRQSWDVIGKDGGAIGLANGDEACRTPSSKEHKIPTILNCPPAPRKPRRVVLCKRKLSELEFFEVMGRHEVDSFFQTCFELSSATSLSAKKRRCLTE